MNIYDVDAVSISEDDNMPHLDRSFSRFKYEENIQSSSIYNPYNPVNIKISLQEVKNILSAYGLPDTVHNLALYQRAFVHRSYIRRPDFENKIKNITLAPQPPNCLPLSTKSNENLEFVGDGILEAISKYYLYRRFPRADEGFMTEKKIAIVKNESIGKIAFEMGLHKWLIISRHAEEKKTRTNLKKLGCLFEAFLGAVFLDMNKAPVEDKWFQDLFVTGPGFQMAQKFVENVFERHIDWAALIQSNDNFKNPFQVKIQKAFKITPSYVVFEETLEKGYRIGVFLAFGIHHNEISMDIAHDIDIFSTLHDIRNHLEMNNGKTLIFIGEAHHKIKRKAEQLACKHALQLAIFQNDE